MTFVLVTGASGFLGAHIVDQLLKLGYKVRGTARSSKADRLRAAYSFADDRFDVVVVDDFSSSDLTAAFEGIEVLVHVASPMPTAGPAEVILKGAINGTTRVLDFAAKSGTVKKVIVTSSVTSLHHINESFTDKVYGADDWNPQTYEDAVEPGTHPYSVYYAAKTVSEQAVRKFAKEHPAIDVSTVHPTYCYGPTAPSHVSDAPADSTNILIYALFQTPAGSPRSPLPPAQALISPTYIHVSDAARAHVLLISPPSECPTSCPGEVKRVVLKSGDMRWIDALEYLTKTRPELKERLFLIPENYEHPEGWARFSGESTEKWIGFKNGSYKDWKVMLDEAVDDILKREKGLTTVKAA
ncbi:NAD-P-binding protein [Stereum hirsutum FP-91666 SS1]|uniref:NAD-P-binding protein n=1 Tax=Stereum hirsutum (strain FP-91666) TaxID=721885 RepID=UPI000440EF1D|nr:NAD-P-binding protein [Stereum hirsutum FP-91666 SS1]EIM91332.1 NAD-P-binding protein [Stereum hirsutum FP-91666 SS1]